MLMWKSDELSNNTECCLQKDTEQGYVDEIKKQKHLSY